MANTPPKPKRRRWLWLVIGFVLVCIGGLVARRTWRQAPDSRLVGRWSVAGDDGSGSEIILWSNGYGALSDRRGNDPNRFTWDVRDGILYRSPLTGAMDGRLVVIVWKEFGGPPWWDSRADIRFVTKDIVDLQVTLATGARRREVLTRLPE